MADICFIRRQFHSNVEENGHYHFFTKSTRTIDLCCYPGERNKTLNWLTITLPDWAIEPASPLLTEKEGGGQKIV